MTVGTPDRILSVEDSISILRKTTVHTVSTPVNESPANWVLRANAALSQQRQLKRQAAEYVCETFPSLSEVEREEATEELFRDLYPPSADVPERQWGGKRFYSLHESFKGLNAPVEIVALLHLRLIPAVERYLNLFNVSEYPVVVYREVFSYPSFPAALLEEAFFGEEKRIVQAEENRQGYGDDILPYYKSETFAAIVSARNCPLSIQEWGAGHADKQIVQAVVDNMAAADEHRVHAQLRLFSWTEEKP
jgi:hypothetical protein